MGMFSRVYTYSGTPGHETLLFLSLCLPSDDVRAEHDKERMLSIDKRSRLVFLRLVIREALKCTPPTDLEKNKSGTP